MVSSDMSPNPAESAALLHAASLQLYRSKDAEEVVQGLKTMVSFYPHTDPKDRQEFAFALLTHVIQVRVCVVPGSVQYPFLTGGEIAQIWLLAREQSIVSPNTTF